MICFELSTLLPFPSGYHSLFWAESCDIFMYFPVKMAEADPEISSEEEEEECGSDGDKFFTYTGPKKGVKYPLDILYCEGELQELAGKQELMHLGLE